MIPALEELKTYPNWIGWKIINRRNKSGEIKKVKLPMNPHTGRAASHNNPDTWGTIQEACHAVRIHRWIGPGFVFDGNGIVGIDLDKCLNGSMDKWASDIIRVCNSYTEISPSGKGVHIFVRGVIPRALKRNGAGIEIYSTKRYFTMTGNHIKETQDVINPAQDALDYIFENYAPKEKPVVRKTYMPSDVSQKEVMSALASLPTWFEDYHQWLAILAAVYSQYPDWNGINMVEAWSPGYEGEVAQKWRSFLNTGVNTPIQHLFKVAYQYGWVAPTTYDVGQKVKAIKGVGRITAKKFMYDYMHYKVGGVWYPECLLETTRSR